MLDINSKLFDSLIGDTLNTLDKNTKLEFENKAEVEGVLEIKDIEYFNNFKSLKLNNKLFESNVSRLDSIIKKSTKEYISVTADSTNRIQSKIFDLVLSDINKESKLTFNMNEELANNNFNENIVFLSSKTKNKEILEKEQDMFENGIRNLMLAVKSNILIGKELVVDINDFTKDVKNTINYIDNGIKDSISLIAGIKLFSNSTFSISTQDTINCYTNCHCNCHSNCHSNCHGSRGWR